MANAHARGQKARLSNAPWPLVEALGGQGILASGALGSGFTTEFQGARVERSGCQGRRVFWVLKALGFGSGGFWGARSIGWRLRLLVSSFFGGSRVHVAVRTGQFLECMGHELFPYRLVVSSYDSLHRTAAGNRHIPKQPLPKPQKAFPLNLQPSSQCRFFERGFLHLEFSPTE